MAWCWDGVWLVRVVVDVAMVFAVEEEGGLVQTTGTGVKEKVGVHGGRAWRVSTSVCGSWRFAGGNRGPSKMELSCPMALDSAGSPSTENLSARSFLMTMSPEW